MKQKSTPTSPNLARPMAVLYIAFGLIIFTAYIIHWSEYDAYRQGTVINGTITDKWINEAGEIRAQITFVEDDRIKSWTLEGITREKWDRLAAGDEVVALQMANSPSRLILAESLTAVKPDWSGGVITLAPILIGLAVLLVQWLYRRQNWAEADVARWDTRLFGLLVGGIFLLVFVGGTIDLLGRLANGRMRSLIPLLCLAAGLLLFGIWFSKRIIRTRRHT